jgi:AcrR family transcriptional regulator
MSTKLLGEAKQRILIAAESLFAEQGLTGVSLRQITSKAGANLAAVNYHFYDKESLCREIITRRIRPINATRLEALGQAEARQPDTLAPLEEIMETMARPLFICGSDPAGYNPASRRLLGRIFIEPLPFASEILAAEMQPAMTRFGQAIRRHVPSLSPQDFVWRYSFIVGAMHHAMATLHDMKARTNGVCRNDDSEGALRIFTSLAVKAYTY